MIHLYCLANQTINWIYYGSSSVFAKISKKKKKELIKCKCTVLWIKGFEILASEQRIHTGIQKYTMKKLGRIKKTKLHHNSGFSGKGSIKRKNVQSTLNLDCSIAPNAQPMVSP